MRKIKRIFIALMIAFTLAFPCLIGVTAARAEPNSEPAQPGYADGQRRPYYGAISVNKVPYIAVSIICGVYTLAVCGAIIVLSVHDRRRKEEKRQ